MLPICGTAAQSPEKMESNEWLLYDFVAQLVAFIKFACEIFFFVILSVARCTTLYYLVLHILLVKLGDFEIFGFLSFILFADI